MSLGKVPKVHGRHIPLSEARKMINDYQTKADPSHLRSLTISADHLRKIIDQPGCEHVRFFVGLQNPSAKNVGIDGSHSLVAVGVDAKNANIVNGEMDTMSFEDMTHCPPTCDPDDPGSSTL